MKAPSGSAFLVSCGMMDRLGLKISCVPVRVRDSKVLLKIGLWRVNLVVATELLTYCGMEPFLSVRLTSL